MFYHFAIHVGNVEGPIRRVGELNGTKPDVFRGKEFDFLFIGRPPGHQANTIWMKLFPVDKI